MRVPQFRRIALTLLGGVALSGCAYGIGDPYGGGYGGVSVGYSSGYGYGGGYGGGYGYDPYGYSGYGSPYGYAGYGSGYGYGSPYGYGSRYGYGSPYGGYNPFGWYGNSYYPGIGIYVYDRHHRRRRWSNAEQSYWQQRIASRRPATDATTRSVAPRENWSGLDRSRVRTSAGPAITQGPSRERRQRRLSSTPSNSDSATTTTRPAREGRRGRRPDGTNEQ